MKRFSFFWAGLLALFAGLPARASHEDVGFGARAMGMGDSFTAMPEDFTAVAFNPATLGQIQRTQLEAGVRRLFISGLGVKDIDGMGLGAGIPLQGSFQGALGVWGLQDIQGQISLDKTLAFSYGTRSWRELDWATLDVGVSLKSLQRSGRSISGSISKLGIDIGTFLHLGDGQALGLSLLNLNGPRTDLGGFPDRAPVIFKLGYALGMRGFKVAMDVTKREPSANLRAHNAAALGAERELSTVQYGSFALRTGLNVGLARAVSLGLGWRMVGMSLDYGLRIPFHPGESRVSHAVSLSYRFGDWNPESQYERLLSSELKYRQDLAKALDAAELRQADLAKELQSLKQEMEALRSELGKKAGEAAVLKRELDLKRLEERRLKAQKNLEEIQKEKERIRLQNKELLYREDWEAYRRLKEQGASQALLMQRLQQILRQHQGSGVNLGEANQELQRLTRQ